MLFMVQEYMSGGSIDGRLWDQPLESLSEFQRLVWACDIAEGMAVIHQRGFTHRDLKSQNVLCDLGRPMRAKVADFGESRAMSASVENLAQGMRDTMAAPMTANIGTVPWMAPELCRALLERREQRVEYDSRGAPCYKPVEYSQKVDVYAFGIVLHEILTHRPPWESEQKVLERVAAGERPNVPRDRRAAMPDFCRLMEACWHQDPAQRPRFEVVLENLTRMHNTAAQTGGMQAEPVPGPSTTQPAEAQFDTPLLSQAALNNV